MIMAPRPVLRVQVFADGADLETMRRLADDPAVKGFTTNPTLMRQGGVGDYATFGREVLRAIPDKPVSFEVLADTPAEIRRQALAIAGWGDNVYVKVPITTTEGEPLTDLVGGLAGLCEPPLDGEFHRVFRGPGLEVAQSRRRADLVEPLGDF